MLQGIETATYQLCLLLLLADAEVTICKYK